MGIACIGGGGQGYWDTLAVGKRDDIVAIADVDFGMAYKAFKAFPKAAFGRNQRGPTYRDLNLLLPHKMRDAFKKMRAKRIEAPK
mgnify:CR=1 FL=1